jgi:hypothetical protein
MTNPPYPLLLKGVKPGSKGTVETWEKCGIIVLIVRCFHGKGNKGLV